MIYNIRFIFCFMLSLWSCFLCGWAIPSKSPLYDDFVLYFVLCSVYARVCV